LSDIKIAFAKLAGVLKAMKTLLDHRSGHNLSRPTQQFSPRNVGENFQIAERQLTVLRERLPALYGDFPRLQIVPTVPMQTSPPEPWYSRDQVSALARDIEQIFETRAYSELATPEAAPPETRVFISHGRTDDWREVQAYVERDLAIKTLELAQEPSQGRTVLQKLEEESSRCNYAVIVMTGEDRDAEGNARARENVLHEIGYFQGKFGLSAVCVLHEEGTSLPSNIGGLVYVPFTRGQVQSTFSVLARELAAFYLT